MRDILYLSFDSLREGVGASQVLAYMRKVAPHFSVTIVSFEKQPPTLKDKSIVEKDGLIWVPLEFGKHGPIGGILRVYRMWKIVDRSKVIHARSALPAFAALLKLPSRLIWDCRALQSDQRRALSENKSVNLTFIAMRAIEYCLAKMSHEIIVITNAVIPIFISRYKIPRSKIHVISTCVDLEKFQIKPSLRNPPIKILFAGTFSPAYDIDLINKLRDKLQEFSDVKLTVATSLGSTNLWEGLKYDEVISVPHEQMPELISRHDLGISVWKNDLGVCLKSVASTKTAEFLASGRPVLMNSLQGDFGTLIADNRAGVVTQGASQEEINEYAYDIIKLLGDSETPMRCRALAEKELSLDLGVKELTLLYKRLQLA
jgi:glycosyltransferase involved in cell wall biosynthesis